MTPQEHHHAWLEFSHLADVNPLAAERARQTMLRAEHAVRRSIEDRLTRALYPCLVGSEVRRA